ncbi:medium chain dehydrogenase/reductase family protein [Saccharothrix luteola]|uniref:medium chain dehydrogenase/reductase family protein n=1 Tax=Saccharothrix luteola TaxID=2893018 RepID=UPI001E5063FE|nr:medium chain dehydrogenase/reductase family protein [Saccharothrix luteola]MCC8246370.1 medium chain dehydrogenase/reductase family protein [Saccharothrix luteola]
MSEQSAEQVLEVVLPGVVEPEGFRLRRRERPTPGPGQALVRVEASGVSFAEKQMRKGKYFDQPPFPFVPGYDLVGTVASVGAGVDPGLVGGRFAALTKTGGWTSHAVVDAADLVPVPAGVDVAEAAALVVNGVTAWQLAHGFAEVRAGQTVLVLGANGGVGSLLVQLAVLAGARVIGTASARHHDAVRALGAIPVDYRDADVPGKVRELAPDGVDAVFDHVGGPGLVDSYRLLARRGALIAYGSASTKDEPGSAMLPVLKLVVRLLWWNALPNGRRATFFNVWAGKRNRARFRARLARDLGSVFALLADGSLSPRIAARVPLERVVDAVRLAESGAVTGKVILLPQRWTE